MKIISSYTQPLVNLNLYDFELTFYSILQNTK